MTAPKWTPGPWRQGEDNDRYLWSLHIFAADPTDDEETIKIAWASCQDDGAQSEKGMPRMRPALANARLIAAAPELYDALATMVEWFGKPHPEEYVDGGASYRGAMAAADTARAALAKARGER